MVEGLVNTLACPYCNRDDGLEREYREDHYGYQRVRFTVNDGARTEHSEGSREMTREGPPEQTGDIWCSHCEDDFHERLLVQLDGEGRVVARQPPEQGVLA